MISIWYNQADMKQKIVFFGSGSYSIPVIQMLLNHGLVLVLTTESDGPLIAFLQKNSVNYATTKVTGDKKIAKEELWKKVEDARPTLGILASFGALIPQHIIDLFPNGIWNIHPSLLPKYKGPSPVQYSILAGETETGVTIISLDDQIDHGPILAQKTVSLTGQETTAVLLDTLFATGASLIEQLLDQESVDSAPQNHTKESWSEKISKEDGYINLDTIPSVELIDRMIRAYYPWPGVWTKAVLYGKEKIIKFLPDQNIQVEGKKVMSYDEFINGYQEEGRKLLTQLQLI
jgi:methionyl-tRNA formyltransferase